MPTSRKPLREYDAKDLTVSDQAYIRARAKRAAHALMVKTFRELEQTEGFSQAELSRRLGIDPSVVSRDFASPKNISVSRLSEYLIGMNFLVRFERDAISEIQPAQQNHPHWQSPDYRHQVSSNLIELHWSEDDENSPDYCRSECDNELSHAQ